MAVEVGCGGEAVTAFERCYAATLGHEGGYSNHPGDPGGETWKGVSRRRWPEWKGWSIVDRHKRLREFPDSLYEAADLEAHVKAFYLANFWTPLKCGEMPEPVAAKVFDVAVNTGSSAAAWMLQAALILSGAELRADGKIGPRTVEAVAKVGEPNILPRLRAVQAGYYCALVVKVNPKLSEFVNGWLKRAAA